MLPTRTNHTRLALSSEKQRPIKTSWKFKFRQHLLEAARNFFRDSTKTRIESKTNQIEQRLSKRARNGPCIVEKRDLDIFAGNAAPRITAIAMVCVTSIWKLGAPIRDGRAVLIGKVMKMAKDVIYN